MKLTKKEWLLIAIFMLATIALFSLPPIPQDPGYHNFADLNMYLGIPNFWNVLSNAFFFLVGLYGLYILRNGMPKGGLEEFTTIWRIFFVGVLCVAFGSGYYHWAPSNQTLIWDRLPMTVAFMPFLAIVIGEHISSRLGRSLVLPLLLVGVASVFWWAYTESKDAGDLRLYALVQFLPMLLIPAILLLYKSPFGSSKWIWWTIAAYALSKLLEYADGPLYGAIGFGGHALKHVAAAVGTLMLLLALKYRSKQPASSAEPNAKHT